MLSLHGDPSTDIGVRNQQQLHSATPPSRPLSTSMMSTASNVATGCSNADILTPLSIASPSPVSCLCNSDREKCLLHRSERRDHCRGKSKQRMRRPVPILESKCQPRPMANKIVPKKLSSQTSWLASWLVQAIEDLQFQFTWIVLGPSILGQDLCFDTAVIAFCQASDVYLRRKDSTACQDDRMLAAALANYGRAVTLLRHKLTLSGHVPSESATATSSALATFDLLIADGAEDKISHSASFAHFEACKWFLEAQAKSPSSPPSTMARAFFQDYCRFELFRVCSLGKLNAVTGSVCENTYWSGMEPFSITPLPSHYTSLQRASHEIDLRLARLTQYVRMLRDGDEISTSDVTSLADLMLEFENLPAENETLHRVRVVRTADVTQRHIVPYSFEFDSQHWPMLIHYEATMLTLVRLCLLIDFLARKQHGLKWLNGERTSKLVATEDRMVSNLLMSSQYAFARSIVARLQVVHPLVIVWATLAGRSTTPSGIAVVEMKQYILTQLQQSGVSFLRDWTEKDLDSATEVFSIPASLMRVSS